jgi:hypothetical protein
MFFTNDRDLFQNGIFSSSGGCCVPTGEYHSWVDLPFFPLTLATTPKQVFIGR